MKLAVDTHHLLLEYAGTKRVTLNILEQLRNEREIELIELKPSYSLKPGKGIFSKLRGHFIRFFWVQIHLPCLCFFERVDFLLSPEYYTPIFTSCKRGVIAHDAHIRAQRQFISSLWFYFYYLPFIEYAIRRADVIFTVSEFSKVEMISLMRLDDSRLHVAYNGIDPAFTRLNPGRSADVLSRAGLVVGEYILFVGTFEARKNIEGLIRAFALLKSRTVPSFTGIKLAIIGKASLGRHSDRNTQISDLIDTLQLRGEIVLCGFVPDSELPVFYRSAAMVAFPSLYEGFGLPIIEGFASQVPVMTSNTCSMPEIAGNAALLCDPSDIRDMAAKMEKLLVDQQLRNQLISAGIERVKFFTWQRCTARLLLYIRRSVSQKKENVHT